MSFREFLELAEEALYGPQGLQAITPAYMAPATLPKSDPREGPIEELYPPPVSQETRAYEPTKTRSDSECKVPKIKGLA